MVSIENVDSGLLCNCKCPNCGSDLVARKWEINMHHFAHFSWWDCEWAFESTIHKLAKQIIEETKQLHLPNRWGKFTFDKIVLEEMQNELIPDAKWYKGDRILWIEFANTHFVDEFKKNKIKELWISCIEIDIRGQSMESLKNFLLNKNSNREWINNPRLESQKNNNPNTTIPIDSFKLSPLSIPKRIYGETIIRKLYTDWGFWTYIIYNKKRHYLNALFQPQQRYSRRKEERWWKVHHICEIWDVGGHSPTRGYLPIRLLAKEIQ